MVYLWSWGRETGQNGTLTAQVGRYYVVIGLQHPTGMAIILRDP